MGEFFYLLKRSVALCLASSLILYGPAGFAAPAQSSNPIPLTQERPVDLSKLSIPKEIGSVKETFSATKMADPSSGGKADEKTVFVIQDAHEIPDAQRNIQKLVDFIQTQYGTRLVALEGAATNLDPQIFRSFPDQKLLKQVFEEYREAGELTGGTAAAIFTVESGHPTVFTGVEDWALYEEGLQYFLEAAAAEETVTKRINALLEDLKLEKEKHYSKELLEIDRAIQAFRKNETDLLSLLQKLRAIRPPGKGSELGLLSVEIDSSRQDPSTLETEVREMAEEIRNVLKEATGTSHNLSFPGLTGESSLDSGFRRNDGLGVPLRKPERVDDLLDFNRKFQELQTSKITSEAFALFLKGLAAKYEMKIKVSETLERGIEHQKRLKEIEGTKLFDDLEIYAESVKASLFRNNEERRLDARSRELELLERLAKLELTRKEWRQIVDCGVRIVPCFEQSKIQNLDSLFSSHFRFYELASERDTVLFNNLLKFLNRNTRRHPTPDTRQPAHSAILIAGGFHAEGITEALKSKNISYALIVPAIERIPDDTHYRAHMKGEVSWADYFEVQNGKVNLYDAFVRAARDKLFKGYESEVLDSELIRNSKFKTENFLLKLWRDQIIRDLANQGRLSETKQYTRFIDELTLTQNFRQTDGGSVLWRTKLKTSATHRGGSATHSGGQNSLLQQWQSSINRFISGLRNLKSQNQITEANILKLLQLSAIPAAATAAASLAHSELRADLIPKISPRDVKREVPAVSLGGEQSAKSRSEFRNLQNAVAFNDFVSALRNHIGKEGSALFGDIRRRIINHERPLEPDDPIGNISNVDTLGTFIEEHFAVPEEAVREIITNAYDAMRNEPDSEKRHVDVILGGHEIRISDTGGGMGIDTVLKRFFPPFASGKRSKLLANLRTALDTGSLSDEDKISRITAQVETADTSELSEVELLSLNDVRRTLATRKTEQEKIATLKNIVIFTGRFGIGFYSLLYFIQGENDVIEVETSNGKETYKITYYKDKSGKLQVAVEPREPPSKTGTSVYLRSRAFSSEKAKNVITEFLSFNANAKIAVSEDEGKKYTIINKEVFDPQEFELLTDDETAIQTFYSKKKNSNGKTKVHITVHGVTILSKEIEGYSLPEKVIFNFPANIGLPISRNKIEVNDLFIEKAKDMIRLIGPHPHLLSAFYPLIRVLEANAKGSARGVLTSEAQAQVQSWGFSYVYLPHSEAFSKLLSKNVFLVDPNLARHAQNYYSQIGERLKDSSGRNLSVGKKEVYTADFSDHTKFVATHDAIFINRRFLPETDQDRALYNVLFNLEKEPGRFAYVSVSGSEEVQLPLAPSTTHADWYEINDSVFEPVLSKLSASKRAFVTSQLRNTSSCYERHLKDVEFYSNLFDLLVERGYFLQEITPDDAWRLPRFSTYHIEEEQIRNIVQEDEILKNLHVYLSERGKQSLALKLFSELLDYSNNSEITMQEAMAHLWKLREYLDPSLLHDRGFALQFYSDLQKLLVMGSRLGEESFQIFATLLEKHIGALSSYDGALLHLLMHWRRGNNGIDPADSFPFNLFLEDRMEKLKKMARILHKFNQKYQNDSFFRTLHLKEKLSVLLSQYNEEQVMQFIDRFELLSHETVGAEPYGKEHDLLYFLRIVYGKKWQEKWDEYRRLPYRGNEINALISLLRSSLPPALKEKYIDALFQLVSLRDEEFLRTSNTDWNLPVSFGFDVKALEHIDHPALFIEYLTYTAFVLQPQFLHELHRKRNPDQTSGLGQDYYALYRKEMMRKLIVIYEQIKDLQEGDQNAVLTDFALVTNVYNYRSIQITSRVQPYINFLMSPETVQSLSAHDLRKELPAQREFSLVSLYDTYLELDQAGEEREEAQPALVDSRINRAASNVLSDERREALQDAFRAAAKQSVDEFVYLREVVQNVIDETRGLDEEHQVVEIRTYEDKIKDETGEHNLIVLDFQDKIGMSAQKLFNKLLMPFSTTKKGVEGLLGEQGQGFFTLLAHAEYVVIKTTWEGEVRILKLIPERLNGEVVDYRVSEAKRAAFDHETNGTRMQAAFRADYPELESERIASAVEKFAGLVDQETLRIIVNGRAVNIPLSRRHAVESSPYGIVQFYSTPGESSIALGGLSFKTVDDDFAKMIPNALRPMLLNHGVGISLPGGKRIKRIQGGSDIAQREEVYEAVEPAVAMGSLKLAIGMFAQGDIQSLDILGYDYYKQTHLPHDIESDARAIFENRADMQSIREKYLGDGRSNKLSQLLLALPLAFLAPIFGEPLSLSELFHRYEQNPNSIDESTIQKLPRPLQAALGAIKKEGEAKSKQAEKAVEMGIPPALVNQSFLALPDITDGMEAYWAFLELTDRVAAIAMSAMRDEYTDEKLGSINERVQRLSANPPAGFYYAHVDGLSAAHALQGQNIYAWNLMAHYSTVEFFSRFLADPNLEPYFLDRYFENVVNTLTHEMIHLLEQSGEETHNDAFFKRQRMMVSALIAKKNEVADALTQARRQYSQKHGVVSLVDFLQHVHASQESPQTQSRPSAFFRSEVRTREPEDLRKGLCVTGDTLLPVVKTGKGERRKGKVEQKRIVDVRAGDWVLSLDEAKETIVPRRIKGLLDMGTKPVYRLATASGRSIKTTANHPYLVKLKTSATQMADPSFGGQNSKFKTSERAWVKVSGLRVGDEIAVPRSRSRPSINVFPLIDARNHDRRSGEVEQNPVFSDSKTVGRRGEIDERFSERHGFSGSDKKLEFFFYPAPEIGRKLLELTNGKGGKLDSVRVGKGQFINPSFSLMFLKGTFPSFSAIRMLRFSLRAILGLRGRDDSIASMSQPTGLWVRYSFVETFFSYLSSKAQTKSQNDFASKTRYWGEFLESTTTAALKSFGKANPVFLRVLGMEAHFSSASNWTRFRSGSFKGTFERIFYFPSAVKSNIRNERFLGVFSKFLLPAAFAEMDGSSFAVSDIVWDPIVSIEPIGLEPVYDIEVEGTHNFIGNGIFAHNTYLSPPVPSAALPAPNSARAEVREIQEAENREGKKIRRLSQSESLDRRGRFVKAGFSDSRPESQSQKSGRPWQYPRQSLPGFSRILSLFPAGTEYTKHPLPDRILFSSFAFLYPIGRDQNNPLARLLEDNLQKLITELSLRQMPIFVSSVGAMGGGYSLFNHGGGQSPLTDSFPNMFRVMKRHGKGNNRLSGFPVKEFVTSRAEALEIQEAVSRLQSAGKTFIPPFPSRSETRMSAEEMFRIGVETKEGLTGKLNSEIVKNEPIFEQLSVKDRARLIKVLTRGDDFLTRLQDSSLNDAEKTTGIFSAAYKLTFRLLRFINSMLAKYFNKPIASGELDHTRTTIFRLSKPVEINGRIFKAIKIKGGRIPISKEITSFVQTGDRQPSVSFTMEARRLGNRSVAIPLIQQKLPEPYQTMHGEDAQREFYATKAAWDRELLVNASVAYGLSERIFSFQDRNGELVKEPVGYYVSLLTNDHDERFFETVRKRVKSDFKKWQKGSFSQNEAQELKEWMHEIFRDYGNALRNFNEFYAHGWPHSGNVNLEGKGFNFQDNDSMILLDAVSRGERLGYLMNDLLQFLQAIHEFERTRLPDGVEVKLYGKDQARIVQFLKSIGINVQKAALGGYFQHTSDDPRIDQIKESKTLDDLFLATRKPIDETHPIAQLFLDEFPSLRSEIRSSGVPPSTSFPLFPTTDLLQSVLTRSFENDKALFMIRKALLVFRNLGYEWGKSRLNDRDVFSDVFQLNDFFLNAVKPFLHALKPLAEYAKLALDVLKDNHLKLALPIEFGAVFADFGFSHFISPSAGGSDTVPAFQKPVKALLPSLSPPVPRSEVREKNERTVGNGQSAEKTFIPRSAIRTPNSESRSEARTQENFRKFWSGFGQDSATEIALRAIVGEGATLDGIEAFAPGDVDRFSYVVRASPHGLQHQVTRSRRAVTMAYQGTSYRFYHKTIEPSKYKSPGYAEMIVAEYDQLRLEHARTKLAYENGIAPRMEKLEIAGIPHLISMHWGEELPLEIDQSLLEEIAEKLGRLHGLGLVHGDWGPKEPSEESLPESDYSRHHMRWDPSSGEVRFIDFGEFNQTEASNRNFDDEKRIVEQMLGVETRGLKDLFDKAYSKGRNLGAASRLDASGEVSATERKDPAARSEMRMSSADKAGLTFKAAEIVVEALRPQNPADYSARPLNPSEARRIYEVSLTDPDGLVDAILKTWREHRLTSVEEPEENLGVAQAAMDESKRLLEHLRAIDKLAPRVNGTITIGIRLAGGGEGDSFLSQLVKALEESAQNTEVLAEPSAARILQTKKTPRVSIRPVTSADWRRGLQTLRSEQADVPVAVARESANDPMEEMFNGVYLDWGKLTPHRLVEDFGERLLAVSLVELAAISSDPQHKAELVRRMVDPKAKAEYLKTQLLLRLADLGYPQAMFAAGENGFLALDGGAALAYLEMKSKEALAQAA